MQSFYYFNPNKEDIDTLLSTYCYKNTVYENINRESRNTLEKYIVNNDIDVSKLENDWFKMSNSRIFISHSHKDEKLAICFSNFIKDKLNVESFIDSCVWKNVNDLLEDLNNKYSITKDGKNYYHEKAKEAAQHTYMILNVALQKQINKCDCAIFINTNNSISKIMNNGVSITKSPWIYSELSFINILQYNRVNSRSQRLNEDFAYKVNLQNTKIIDLLDIEKISREINMNEDPIDKLDKYMKTKSNLVY